MKNQMLLYLIVFLSSVAVGMAIGLMTREGDSYHGPNAKNFSRAVKYNTATGKCYKFGVYPVKCPPSKNRMDKWLDKFARAYGAATGNPK